MREINQARQESSAQSSQVLFDVSRMETELGSAPVRVEGKEAMG